MRLDDLEGDRCDECGRGFEASSTRQRFCCRACEQESRRPKPRTLSCPHCGVTFTCRHGLRKYCTAACRSAANRAFDLSVGMEARRRARMGRTCRRCGCTFDAPLGNRVHCETCRPIVVREARLDATRRWRARNPQPKPLHSLDCRRCGGGFEALDQRRLYCDPCRPLAAQARVVKAWRRYDARKRRRRPQSPAEQIAIAMQWSAVASGAPTPEMFDAPFG